MRACVRNRFFDVQRIRIIKSTLPKIIVIVGPTASGKTDLGIFLAKKFKGEIVNADSRQIYREMNIGTGKPIFENKKIIKKRKNRVILNWPIGQFSITSVFGVPHHLFNIAWPDRVVTVAEWKQKAIKIIRAISRRGSVPIVVGGTGLYMKTLVENWEIPHVPPNEKMRAQFEKELKKKGIGSLWKRLMKLDPDARGVVQKNNPRRVIRALEVCLATGKPFTAQRVQGPPLFDVLELGISFSRQKLYDRIDARVDWQMKHGLIEETRRLIKKYPFTLPAMSGIGYCEIAEYLKQHANILENVGMLRNGSEDMKRVKEKIKFRTHDYARRQMTWFRRDVRIHWVRSRVVAIKMIKSFLKQ